MEDEKILTKEVQQAEESLQRDRDVEEGNNLVLCYVLLF